MIQQSNDLESSSRTDWMNEWLIKPRGNRRTERDDAVFIENPLSFAQTLMASRHPQPPLTTTPTPTTTMSKRKDLFPINPPLNKARTTGRKTVDPFEARLHHIRIHLLSDKTIKKRIHAEPTRVLDPFLYLGGLQSLNDQVSDHDSSFAHHPSRLLNTGSSSAVKHYSYSVCRLLPIEIQSHSWTCQASLSQSRWFHLLRYLSPFSSGLSIHRRSTPNQWTRPRSLCLWCLAVQHTVLCLFDQTSRDVIGRSSRSPSISSVDRATQQWFSSTTDSFQWTDRTW